MSDCHPKQKNDWLLIGSSTVIIISYLSFLLSDYISLPPHAHHFFHSLFELVNTMWWGVLLGIFFVGLLSFIPREVVIATLGRPEKKTSIIRAVLAGVLLDLCNHGILMVAVKLYERGASIAQVMAFLIASPWNSFSVTLILFSLVGLPLTLGFIILSAAIALVTGLILQMLLHRKILKSNPNEISLPDDFSMKESLRESFRGKFSSYSFWKAVVINGLHDGRMVMRWIFFGMVLSALVRALVPQEIFMQYLGPTLAGLGLTLGIATVLEVCSEGSVPLAADFVTRAQAPGNAFAFLMAGVSTDYTEVMSLRSMTGSWKITLMLPLLSIPQVLIISYFMNQISY